MKSTSFFSKSVVFALAFLVVCVPSKEAVGQELSGQQHDDVHDAVAEVITKMPAAGEAEQEWLNEQLVEMGPAGFRALLAKLAAPGTGDDTYARYAVSGLAKHVSRPDAESDRQAFEEVLLDELEAGRSRAVKVFLMEQLELVGSEQAVSVMEPFLDDETLYEPAAEVLVAVQTPSAIEVIQQAIAAAEGASKGVALIKALGDVQDESATEELLQYASADDWSTRQVALYALARSGNPVAAEALSQAADTTGSSRQREARAYYLLYAERLVEEGHAAEGAEISHQLLAGDYPGHVKRSALSTLVQAEGDGAIEELLDVATADDPKLRAAALSLAATLPGSEVTEAFVSALEEAPSSAQADMIRMLQRREDTPAVSALEPFLTDSSVETRLAAIDAVAALGGADVLPELLDALNRAEEEEIEAIEAALLRMPTDEMIPAVAEALSTAPDEAKATLIRVLAERQAKEHTDAVLSHRTSSSEEVRLEVYRALQALGTSEDVSQLIEFLSDAESEDERSAIRDAIVAVSEANGSERSSEVVIQSLAEAPDRRKPDLLQILPRMGGEEALDAVMEATGSSDDGVREAAVQALAAWPDPDAAPSLLEALDAASESDRIELLEGYIRLVNRSDHSSEEKLQRLHEAVEAANTSEEKAAVVEYFSEVESSLALRAASKYFTDADETVRERATDVGAKLLATAFASDAVSRSNASFILSVLEASVSPELKEQIEQQIAESDQEISSDADADAEMDGSLEEYVELFNGENLDGWESVDGSSGGWEVSDGILYTDGSGHGWLATDSTYDDFILELEYRVPEGGNSGVFLRAPREGNPAYQGLEIQVLDDYADEYSDLNAWQYTGSIYSVKAPSKRATKPAGEWQTMEIVADGPNIQVTLNGELVVHTTLIDFMHRADEHPGLKRRKGYIGLQNHSTRIEYRNITITELP